MTNTNEIGNRYGKLVVMKLAEGVMPGAHWLCRCDCGTEKVVRGRDLRTRNTKSCGCGHGNRKYSREDSTWQVLYCVHKNTSDKWGALPFDDWKLMVQQPCSQCGLGAPERTYKSGDPVLANGIDRIDSTKGYVLGNVQPMCWQCNRAKLDYTQEQFDAWQDRLARFKGYVIRSDCND